MMSFFYSLCAYMSTDVEISFDGEVTMNVIIIAAVVAAIIVAGIFVGVICYTYKRKLKSPIYPVSQYASLDLCDSSDQYLSSTVTRVRVQSSNKKN